jgi:citrate lyase subunit beta/citryl-CoA lyase
MLAKIPSLASDALLLDLEDAVAPPDKEKARTLVRATLDTLQTPSRAYVRINGFESGLAEADIRTVVGRGLAGVMLAKAESPAQLKNLDGSLADAEVSAGLAPGALEVIPLVETPLGVLNALSIAFAPRVRALALGGEDLAASVGATRTRDGDELSFARGMVVMAAGAAAIQAIDTVWTDVADEQGLERESRHARSCGFSGKLAIHPRQAPIIETAFSPTPAEVEQARRVVDAFEAAGGGAVNVDGKMVDAPVVRRALRVLAMTEEAGSNPGPDR